MGGPCLGIIPVSSTHSNINMDILVFGYLYSLTYLGNIVVSLQPFIEELNYPMPENCAGGNTSVFVNGRELHPKDLDLLASRGLPTARDRSYIIEISGRVFDEDTGEELDSLGKLAPT